MPIKEYIGPFKKDGSIKDATKIIHSCLYCKEEREIEYRTYKRCNDLCRTCSRMGPPIYPEKIYSKYPFIVDITNLGSRSDVINSSLIHVLCKDCGIKTSREYRQFLQNKEQICPPCYHRSSRGYDFFLPKDIDGIVDFNPETLGVRGQLSDKTEIEFICEMCGNPHWSYWYYYRDGGRYCFSCSKQSEERNNKISESVTELWKSEEFRKKQKESEEARLRKISRVMKKLWSTDEFREKILPALREGIKRRDKNRTNSYGNGKEMSGPHKDLKSSLDNLGLFGFRSEQWINGQYKVDEVDQDYNKIIEFYGDFFHANPRFYAPEDKMHREKRAQEIWDYDFQREEFLRNQGYDLFIVWESDWNQEKEKVLEDIQEWYND